MRDLQGATALVTGASRGVGPHICAALAARGVAMALIARSAVQLEQVAAHLRQGGARATAVPADLGDGAEIDDVVGRARAALGRIDILVNNAGLDVLGAFHTLAPESIDEVMRVNVGGTMRLTRVVLADMRAAGRGHVVNIASAAGHFGLPYQAVYAASKAALLGFTRSIREECRGSGVSASAVVPTFVLGAGMYERRRVQAHLDRRAPWLLTTTPERVGRAVVRAIEGDRAEVLVNRVPLRPILAIVRLVPGGAAWFLRVFGVVAGLAEAAGAVRAGDGDASAGRGDPRSERKRREADRDP